MLALRVVEHPLVPAVVDGLPHGARPGGDAAADDGVHRRAEHAARRLQALEVADAGRRDGSGRVHAHPAAAREPDFGPGMGVRLPHGPVAVHAIHLAALVARHDACRNAGRAQQHCEGRRDVLAEARLLVEPEGIRRVLGVDARLQRVAVAARAQPLQRGLHEGRGAARGDGRLRQHLPGQGTRARIEPLGQFQVRTQPRRFFHRAVREARVTGGPVAQHLVDGAARDPGEFGRHRRAQARRQYGRLGCGIEREQPGHAQRFQRDFVAQGLALDLQ